MRGTVVKRLRKKYKPKTKGEFRKIKRGYNNGNNSPTTKEAKKE